MGVLDRTVACHLKELSADPSLLNRPGIFLSWDIGIRHKKPVLEHVNCVGSRSWLMAVFIAVVIGRPTIIHPQIPSRIEMKDMGLLVTRYQRIGQSCANVVAMTTEL